MRNKIEHHDKMDQFLHQDLIVGLDYNAQELEQGSKKKSQILMWVPMEPKNPWPVGHYTKILDGS